MTGRWTNLALLLLVPLAACSGLVMFVVGSGPVWLVAVLHGVVGLTVVALVPWKSVVVRRGLRRAPRPGRTTSVALMLLVLAALGSGVAHVVGVLFADAPVTTMQLHVGAGLVAAVLTVVHYYVVDVAGIVVDFDVVEGGDKAHFIDRLVVILHELVTLGGAFVIVEGNAGADDVKHDRALVCDGGLEHDAELLFVAGEGAAYEGCAELDGEGACVDGGQVVDDAGLEPGTYVGSG